MGVEHECSALGTRRSVVWEVIKISQGGEAAGERSGLSVWKPDPSF